MTTTPTPKFETVMIIDDSDMDRYIAGRIITINNFSRTILDYSSAEEALIFLTDNQENITVLPQIIFVDIYMPIMTGFEFMLAYDSLSLTLKNNCKAYIISSSIDSIDTSRAAADKNVTAFWEKPITKEFLASI